MRFVLILLALCMPLVSCSSDPTNVDEVAQAYLASWYRGDGSHRAMEFSEVPDTFPRTYRTKIKMSEDGSEGAIQGPPLPAPSGPVAVHSLTRISMHGVGPGGSKHASEYAFATDERMEPMGKLGNCFCVYAKFEVALEDGSKQHATIFLRPDIPFAKGPVVGPDTRWKVIPGSQ